MTKKWLCIGLLVVGTFAAAQGAAYRNFSANDQNFLNQLTSGDKSEIDLAQLALQKSTDPHVRQFATQILASDKTLERDVRKLAPTTTHPSTKPATAEHKKLAELSSKEFDQEYMRYETGRQQQEMQSLRSEVDTTDDADLLDFGIKAEVKVQDAEKQARAIASELGGSMSAQNAEPNR